MRISRDLDEEPTVGITGWDGIAWGESGTRPVQFL